MADIPWILIAILIALIAGAVFFWKFGYKKQKIDYRGLFYAGIIWMFIGFAMGSIAFGIIGIAIIAMSLAHQKEWKKSKTTKEKRIFISKILVSFALAFVAFIAILFLLGANSVPVHTVPGMNESLCSSSGGHWNECSNSCALDNQGKNYYCPTVCEQLCECAGIAGFNCPDGYRCKTPSGIADALGFCVKA